MKNVLKKQVGGEHYKNLKIQPVEFIQENNLGFLEGCIIKRLCRYKNKGGLEDLRKIQHEMELLISLEYPEPEYGTWTFFPGNLFADSGGNNGISSAMGNTGY